ncbi:MAG: S1 RNA-binding domain-containing protein, partial [Gammaproteobacteria bacterium]|nr:S1 RNA-binding domain-containing protein [Gammaproteobacteria bacterium]
MGESFAELLEQSFNSESMRPGSIVTGTVVGIDDKFVIVNAGLKSEGVIPIEQFFNDDGNLEVTLGDEVDVALDTME